MTLLLNGQAMKVWFGSTSVTCNFGSICFQRARTTRAAKTAADHDDTSRGLREGGQWKRQCRCRGSAGATEFPAADAMVLAHAGSPYFCAASHAAIARNSSSEKPFAMRFMTVDGKRAVAKSGHRGHDIAGVAAVQPRHGGAVVAPAGWQPEQDAAPGGGAEAASTGTARCHDRCNARWRRAALSSAISR